MNRNKELRKLLNEKDILALPGCYDAFSGKILEYMGFPAIYLTGYGTEASRLGRPDMGFTTMSELADHAGNVVDAVSVPLISDVDTGYGGLNNIMRTIHTMEKKGVSGVHLEDQTIPKQCPDITGSVTNASVAEMQARIRAAVSAREDKDFLIIARTDTRTRGMDTVLRRLHAYLDAGADIAMIGERYTMEEYAVLGREFPGQMMICGGILGWDDQNVNVSEFASIGIKMIIYSVAGLGAAGKAVYETYLPLLEQGIISDRHLEEHVWDMGTINRILDAKKYLAVEAKMAEAKKEAEAGEAY